MIRLRSIELTNFKNVEYGKIKFPSAVGSIEGADILGIYGQNGSGKTAVIEALSIFDHILSGGSLDSFSSECIYFRGKEAELELELETKDQRLLGEIISYKILYRITLTHKENVMYLSREQVSCCDLSTEKPRKTILIDHRVSEKDSPTPVSFSTTPKTTWNSLFALSADLETNCAVTERIAHKEHTSFALSYDLVTYLLDTENACHHQEKNLSKNAQSACAQLAMPLVRCILSLRKFVLGLSVLTTANHAHASLNKLFIAPHRNPSDDYFAPDIYLDINKPAVLNRDKLKKLEATITAINTVLVSLVPGLTLEMKSLGNELQDNGDIGTRIEVVSRRNDCALPFRCESEGVKKIVAILGHLIDVYNDENKCVAIDELDAGIFEFLLGEILEVLADQGKGQLIFTAHNLRPLETLPKRSLIFTTTNPKRRYVGFSGIKASNNLRDQYLRAINLGGQSEVIYEPTSKYEIDNAFFEAGCVELSNTSDKEAPYEHD